MGTSGSSGTTGNAGGSGCSASAQALGERGSQSREGGGHDSDNSTAILANPLLAQAHTQGLLTTVLPAGQG